MGRDEVMEHDLRYDRADEFMEVVLGHWDTWDDDAIVQDKATGLFAQPDKVHRLDYEGRYLPLARAVHRAALAAGPPGRHPGRVRAAAARRFGAQWGEVIFVVYPRPRGRQARVRRLQGRRGAARPRPRAGQDHASGQHRGGRDQGRGRGQEGGDREAAARDRRAVAAVRGAELRLRHARAWTSRSPTSELAADVRPAGIRDRVLRSARRIRRCAIHPDQRPRPGAQPDRRRPEGGGRQARAMVRRARLRRLRRVGDPRARRLRGFRDASWCRNCSGAACSARTTPAPRCATISAFRCRRSAPGASRDACSITSSVSALPSAHYHGCAARWPSSNSVTRSGAWSCAKCPTPGSTSKR